MEKEFKYKLQASMKRCPFCGFWGRVEIQRGYLNGVSQKVAVAYCGRCHARGPKLNPADYGSQNKAAEAAVEIWNRRSEE